MLYEQFFSELNLTFYILIYHVTSLKLPLSTTYVTFMVAMGSSLADGAWGRESAVYRITGVVAVIGGWFFTALCAFTVSLIIALILYWSNLLGLLVLIPLAIFLVVKTHAFHSKKTEEESKHTERFKAESFDGESIYERCSSNVTGILVATYKTLNKSIDSLIKEKHKKLKDDVKTAKRLSKEAKLLKKEVPQTLEKITEESFESGHHYIEIIDFLRESMHCVTHIVTPAYEHVDNNHAPFSTFQTESIREVMNMFQGYVTEVVASITNSEYSKQGKTIQAAMDINEQITKIRKKQLKILKKEPGNTRTNMLFMDVLSEMKNLILHINNIYKSFRDFAEQNRKTTFDLLKAIQ